MTVAWSDIEANPEIMRDTNEKVFNSNYSGDLTSGSDVIVMQYTAGLTVGDLLNGVGIVADSVIVAITENVSIEIDNNVTATDENVTVKVKTYSDADLIALYKTTAKTIMYQDIWKAFDNEPDATDLVNDLANNNEEPLNLTLAFLQLALFYQANDDKEDSMNRTKKEYYERLYDNDKNSFNILKRSSSGTIQTGRIII